MVSSCKRDFEEILQTLFSIFLAIADEQTTHLKTILWHKCFWLLGLWRWKRGRLARLLNRLGQGGGRQLLQNWRSVALGDRGEGWWRCLSMTINNHCLLRGWGRWLGRKWWGSTVETLIARLQAGSTRLKVSPLPQRTPWAAAALCPSHC